MTSSGQDPRPDSDRMLFLATLNALTEGVAFLDPQGRLLHENGRLAGLRSAASVPLDHRLATFTKRVRERVDALDIAGATVVEKLVSEEIRLDSEDCLLEGSYIGFDLLGAGPMLMITVTCVGRRPLGEEELRVAYGLTRREINVAGLLAHGRSNSEIADELCISEATARHHTARVLGKVAARSRAEAAAVLLGSRSRVESADQGPTRA